MPRPGFAALLVLVFLTACASERAVGLIPTDAAAPGAVRHDILVATTRARAPESALMFSGERSDAADFAEVSVSVPPVHKAGAVEWPRRAPGDPARDFVTRSRSYIDGEAAFVKQLAAAVKARPRGERVVFVFVHGYNTTFEEGVYRLAQVVHDTEFPGVPVLFTWASRGALFDYVYDRDSSTAARDALEHTLRLAARSGAEQVVLFAHSMGNWVAMEALRQARIAGDPRFGGKLGTVVLAAPDIDVDVFKAEMRRYGVANPPFLLFASSDDKALAASSFISGEKPRLGAFTEPDKVREIADLGVIVIDVSQVDSADSLNHAKFATVAPEIAKRLRARFSAGDQLATGEAPSFAARAAALGGSVGSLIGQTAGAVVTLPATLVTAPVAAAAGGSSGAAASQ